MKKILSVENSKCWSCGSTKLEEIIDLGKQPLANNLCEYSDQPVNKFNLRMVLCKSCKLAQLDTIVDPELLFSNYLYASSTSKSFVEHFQGLAYKISRTDPRFVIDIGSNDGILLNQLRKLKIKCLGIEPAKNLCQKCWEDELPVLNAWADSKEVSTAILTSLGQADVITACNVFAHMKNIHKVLDNVNLLLKPDGEFIIEVQYVKEMAEKGLFDMIYHEHIAYYSLESLNNLLNLHNLGIRRYELINTHGGSIRVYVKKGLNDNFSDNVDYSKLKANKFKLPSKGKVVGYGAPAKATVMCNYLKLTSKEIQYIVDDNPMKQGKFIPATDIAIVSSEVLRNDPDVTHVLLFAWNYTDLIKVIKKLKKGVKVIVPLPEFKIL